MFRWPKIVVYKKGRLDLAKEGFGKAREKLLDLKQLKARSCAQLRARALELSPC